MYNSNKTAVKIKEIAKSKGIKISEIMSACELNINTLSSMSNRGSWVQANSLAKIADYLDCSVDYLLGRTDTPEIKESISNHNTTINGGVKAVKSSVKIGGYASELQLDENQAELLNRFQMLDYEDKMEVMQLIIQKSKKEKIIK